MPSKKSSSPTAASSRSPPTTPSPALTQSPLVFQMYKKRGHHTTTVETTEAPTTTTTSPTPDPYEYEKAAYKTVPMTDDELEQLKEHIRFLNGLPLTRERPKPKVATLAPPKMRPRATLTSWKRVQLQQRRLVTRCGGNLKQKFEEFDRMLADSEDASDVYRRLRNDGMAQTSEQAEALAEQQELQNLKYLAERAKLHEQLEYRDNQGSRLRFKSVRGEPIISSAFRNAYEDHIRPPFVVAGRVRQPKVYLRPKIDKRKEIWLAPVDDDDAGPPLHAQPKTPPPKRKRSDRPAAKKGSAQKDKAATKDKERRSSKESEKSTNKRSKSSPKTAQKGEKKGVRRKRPPWHVGYACPPNVGWST